MTNEQLTQEVMNLKAYQAKAEEEHRIFESMLKRLQDNMSVFTKLAEDVHILAINIETMQKTLESTNKKVDSIMSQEFLEYKENKKIVKQKIIDKAIGGVLGVVGSAIVFFATMYFKG